MIIDTHTHILPPSFRTERSKYIARDATLKELFADADTSLATAEELITAMDEAEVDISIVSGIGWTDWEVACSRGWIWTAWGGGWTS